MSNDALSGLDDLSGLNKKTYLSDVISYERDIAPHRLIEIYAGVGSGKSTLINEFVNGNCKKGIPRLTTLIITSRKAKVAELLADKTLNLARSVGNGGNISWEYWDENPEEFQSHVRVIDTEWGTQTLYEKSVACTNAFIEKHIQNVYDPTDPVTHLWNLFDLIVVDEVHSLVVDAGYQTAPFYVNELIQEICYRHKMADETVAAVRPLCKHVILMTGTPETIEKFPIKHATPHVLDKMEECVNVRPKTIRFLDKKQAIKQIEEQIAAEKRCIYMSNHSTPPWTFLENTSIPSSVVAVSFSKKEVRDEWNKAAQKSADKRTEEESKLAIAYNDMVEAENSITSSGLIPERFKLWISTSRNKEGINILSADINDVYLESHSCSDIVQMAGRVRHGTENLYIIVDSVGFPDKDYYLEYEDVRRNQAPDMRKRPEDADVSGWARNAFLKQLCEKKGLANHYANRDSEFLPYKDKNEEIKKYIDNIHRKEPYVRYDYFRNTFCGYYLRRVSKRYDEKQRKIFYKASLDHSQYQKILQKLFPTAEVQPYKDRIEQMKEYIEDRLDGNPMRVFSEKEFRSHMAALNKLCFDDPKDYLDSPNSLLKYAGYSACRRSHDKSKPSYLQWRYKRIQTEEDVA